ncbi:MAG: NAD(+)/NADH kinase [Bifidobacteriaceae bacterium]|jgi:NAD+ kinase|nr:NAD(+)/NADH kinase [Bifidobacteriaceae bacterium]
MSQRFQRVLVIQSNNRNLDHEVEYIKAYFEEKSFAVDILGQQTIEFGSRIKLRSTDYDFAIVAGGDGTVLYAAAVLRGTDIPIVAINFGHLGFLTSFEPDRIDQAFAKLAAGNWETETRDLISVQVGNHQDFALNECGLFKIKPSQSIKVVVFIDEKEFGSFACDGVVISTATGSTAYNYANGGAIMWPDVEAMQLTVLAGQTRMPLPLVVSKNSQFSIVLASDTKSDALVVNDGFRELPFEIGHTLQIAFSDERASFASVFPSDFSKRLFDKLV